MKLFLLVLISFFIVKPTLANDLFLKKYKDHTPQQIAELSEEVREKEVPMIYIMAAKNALAFGSELLFSQQLNRLMYPAVRSFKDSVNEFQKDIGDTETGVLTVWQIYNLEYRSQIQNLDSVIFPTKFSDHFSEDIASLTGTVTMLDDRIADPINMVEITCYRKNEFCEYNQISLTIPNENSWSHKFSIYKHDPIYFKITRWENGEIDALPENTETCRVTTLNLNFKTKEFFEIAKNGTGNCEFMDTTFPKLEKPRVSQILDGQEIISAEFADLRKKAFDVLASSYRKKVEETVKEYEALSKEQKLYEKKP